MTRPTPASNILIAAVIAIIFAVISAQLSGGFTDNTQIISLVGFFSFISGMLTPWLAQSFAAKAQQQREPRLATTAHPQARESAVTPVASGQNPDGSSQITLYVGNLPFKTTEENVEETFAIYGEVFAVRLVKDRRTGKKKGYGFVEMDPTGADLAITKLNDTEFEGRTLKVRFANTERKE